MDTNLILKGFTITRVRVLRLLQDMSIPFTLHYGMSGGFIYTEVRISRTELKRMDRMGVEFNHIYKNTVGIRFFD